VREWPAGPRDGPCQRVQVVNTAPRTFSPGARWPATSEPISEATGSQGGRENGGPAPVPWYYHPGCSPCWPRGSSHLPQASLAARDSAPLRRPDLAMLDRGRERTAGGVRGPSLLELAGSRLRCGGLAPRCRRRSSRREKPSRGVGEGTGRVAPCPAARENKPGKEGRPMQHRHHQFGPGFRVVLGDAHAQAAEMTLAPGQTEGGPDNRHRGADQWLYVVGGTGEAVVNAAGACRRCGRPCGSGPAGSLAWRTGPAAGRRA
jgi:hypothetical protein